MRRLVVGLSDVLAVKLFHAIGTPQRVSREQAAGTKPSQLGSCTWLAAMRAMGRGPEAEAFCGAVLALHLTVTHCYEGQECAAGPISGRENFLLN